MSGKRYLPRIERRAGEGKLKTSGPSIQRWFGHVKRVDKIGVPKVNIDEIGKRFTAKCWRDFETLNKGTIVCEDEK